MGTLCEKSLYVECTQLTVHGWDIVWASDHNHFTTNKVTIQCFFIHKTKTHAFASFIVIMFPGF